MKLNLKLAMWKREKDHSDPSIDVSEDLEVRGKERTELWFYHRDEAGEDSLGGHWVPGGDVEKMAGNGKGSARQTEDKGRLVKGKENPEFWMRRPLSPTTGVY